jgi:putative transposase
VVGTKAGQHT